MDEHLALRNQIGQRSDLTADFQSCFQNSVEFLNRSGNFPGHLALASLHLTLP
jgi:hypothetical protein